MNRSSPSNLDRDAASLRILGWFFAILGGTVLLATYAALERPHAAIVNAVSGLVLIGVGIGMHWTSRRLLKSKAAPTAGSERI